MRNRALHDQLRGFAELAGKHLDAAVAAGAEIPFEVAENPGVRSVLYHYKPLSGEFLRQRFTEFRAIEGFDTCISALTRVEGTAAYLRTMGATHTPAGEHDRAEQVLKELLAQVFGEVAEFELPAQRFERAYLQFERIVYEDTVVNTVLSPLLGVRLAADRWEVGSGVAVVRGDLVEAPPEAVWASERDRAEPNVLALLTVESTPREPPPLTAARLDFRKLLTALRLFKNGPATLGASAWWRTDDGPWQSVPLGFAGRGRGGEYWLEASDQPGFVELVELMRARPAQSGSFPWALSRFEMGLEQSVSTDGLSDHLLAVRALLDGGEPTDLAMAQRLAVLCAEPHGRSELQRRMETAFKLERLAMRGDADSTYLAAVGAESPDRIAADLEDSLRALLRDVVCGHLQPDVRALADEMLGINEQAPEQLPEPLPRRSNRFARGARTEPKTEPVLDGWGDVDDTKPTTEPLEAHDTSEPDFVVRRTTPHEQPTEDTLPSTGVRELRGEPEPDDWGFDDPSDYSAAI